MAIAVSLWYGKKEHDKSSVVNGRFLYGETKTSGVFDRICGSSMAAMESQSFQTSGENVENAWNNYQYM